LGGEGVRIDAQGVNHLCRPHRYQGLSAGWSAGSVTSEDIGEAFCDARFETASQRTNSAADGTTLPRKYVDIREADVPTRWAN
jgi:hypothetical protein